jgi:hypothetical protein
LTLARRIVALLAFKIPVIAARPAVAEALTFATILAAGVTLSALLGIIASSLLATVSVCNGGLCRRGTFFARRNATCWNAGNICPHGVIVTIAAVAHLIFIAIFAWPPRELDGLARWLVCQPQAVEMLAMLIIAFRHDTVAGKLRIAPQLHVFFGNRLRGAAQFHIWSVAVQHPVAGAATVIATTVTAATTTAMPAAAPAVALVVIVLSRSHELTVIRHQCSDGNPPSNNKFCFHDIFASCAGQSQPTDPIACQVFAKCLNDLALMLNINPASWPCIARHYSASLPVANVRSVHHFGSQTPQCLDKLQYRGSMPDALAYLWGDSKVFLCLW